MQDSKPDGKTTKPAMTDGGIEPSDLTPDTIIEFENEGVWTVVDLLGPNEGAIPVKSVIIEAIAAENVEEGCREECDLEELVPDICRVGVRDLSEVRYSDKKIRDYRSDGTLYAYREGNTHIVVSRGDEPRTRWEKRVPAERTAVLEGEKLWTIPDNWEHRVKIDGADQSRYGIFHIPETEVDVLVSIPHKNHLVDAWYGVKRVGELTVTFDDEFDWDELHDVTEDINDDEKVSKLVTDAVERLYKRRHEFEKEFRKEVNAYAETALFEEASEPVTVFGWTVEPWGEMFYFEPLLEDFLNVNGHVLEEVADIIRHDARLAVPNYPTVRVDVDNDGGTPDGYEIRALVEAEASGAEVIDYLITEYYDLMTQREWGDIRGKRQSAISKNVSGAKRKLSQRY